MKKKTQPKEKKQEQPKPEQPIFHIDPDVIRREMPFAFTRVCPNFCLHIQCPHFPKCWGLNKESGE